MGVFVFSPVNAVATSHIEGYVTDAQGAPVSGAHITFDSASVPPVPATDQSGYYSAYVPQGTYTINVWPTYGSHFLSYTQQGYVVSADAVKNITLTTGNKIEGYVTDANGQGMVGSSVLFKVGSTVYGSGYFTDSQGYFYCVVPDGTYTIDSHPQTAYQPSYSGSCSQYATYTETNYNVDGDANHNIIVGTVAGKRSITGFIRDQNGQPIKGAEIIFNDPINVPSVNSDNTGHYIINAPAGTYHLNVWPPRNSSFIRYDQTSFTVSANQTKNINLETGIKVYGYITFGGSPVNGAVVFLDNYQSGWFSTSDGFYFVAVPPGTYTIDAHPGVGPIVNPPTAFKTYIENNFIVTAEIAKNLSVTLLPVVPTPAPTAQPTSNPTSTPAPNLTSNTITISAEAQNYQVGSTLTLKGALTDQNQNPLTDKTIKLSYSPDNQAWTTIGNAQTDQSGNYQIQWLIPASGTFTVKAE